MPIDAEVLIAFVTHQSTLPELIQARGLTAGEFLEWWDSPAVAAALESLLRAQALWRDLRNDQLRDEQTRILAEIARSTTNAVERRRAATDALRALRSPTVRAASARRNASRPEGALSPITSPAPPRPVIHAAHRTHTSGLGRPAPRAPDTNSPFGTPLVSLARSLAPNGPDEGPDREHPTDRDDPADLSPDRFAHGKADPEPDRQSAAESQHPASLPPTEAHDSPDPIDAELDSIEAEVNRLLGPDRDDAGFDQPADPLSAPGHGDSSAPIPQSPLAFAHHILESIETDPDAFDPQTVRAARVYARFMGDAQPRAP